jgi:hypothetical protein
LERYKRVEDKMAGDYFGEYKQTTIYASKFEINPIMDYLQNNYGLASAGIFNTGEGGKIKVQSHEGKIEIMCNCDKKIVNDLQNLIAQGE